MLNGSPHPELSGRPGHRRRGLTFLEVIFAMALLSLVAATAFAGFSFLWGRQAIEQQKLAAIELANRLVLLYLDDDRSMPDPSLPIEYGRERYRWEMKETPVKITPAEPANPNAAPAPGGTTRAPSSLLLDKTRQVTIRVWLSEESGGSYSPAAGVPSAVITRIATFTFTRNPDARQRMFEDPSMMQRLREEIEGGRSGRGAQGTGSQGNQRQPSSSRPVAPGSDLKLKPK